MCINMSKKKINEIGELLEINSSDIKESKTRTFIKRFTYPLVQITFFIISSISGILLGYWEKQIQIGYPFTSFTSFTRIYRAGIPTILIIHSGNAVFSTKTRKKFGLSNFQTIFIVIINLILSFFSFYFLYQIFAKNQYFGVVPAYGSYRKKINRMKQSKVFFLKKNSIRIVKCELV